MADRTTLNPPLAPAFPVLAAAGIPAPHRLVVYPLCTLACLLCNFLLGKDMPWDAIHYHLYAGLEAWTDRFAQDYFAAGPQSYFVPYAYLPFYLLVASKIPALAAASVLAVVHSSLLWLAYELALLPSPGASWIGVGAALFTLCNPVVLQQIGSSSIDITTAILVLAGWLVLLRQFRRPGALHVLLAAAILGGACALKLTNAVHSVAALALIVLLPGGWRQASFRLAGFGAVLAGTYVSLVWSWASRLEATFGNPVFPLFNNVFRSPQFTSEPLRHYRFLPESLANALWRPFAIVEPLRRVQEELSAPDIRYAALILVAVLWGALALGRRNTRGEGGACAAVTRWPPPDRALLALGCTFLIDWVLWLDYSANSRYFLPGATIAGVVCLALVWRLAPSGKVLAYALITLFGLQGCELWIGADLRWNPYPWGGPWLDVSVPASLESEANLYLTAGTQSNSFLAAFVAPASGFINYSGGYALTLDGAAGARVRALIKRYAPHLRVLTRGAQLYPIDAQRVPTREGLDQSLARLGLKVDPSDCQTIAVRGLPSDLEIGVPQVVVEAGMPAVPVLFLTCRVVPASVDPDADRARRQEVDLILDRVEDACPMLFQPRRLRTEHDGTTWARYYMNTDLRAWVSKGWVKFVDPVRGDDAIYIGTEADWTRGPLKLSCGRHDGHYFATVVPNATPGPQ